MPSSNAAFVGDPDINLGIFLKRMDPNKQGSEKPGSMATSEPVVMEIEDKSQDTEDTNDHDHHKIHVNERASLTNPDVKETIQTELECFVQPTDDEEVSLLFRPGSQEDEKKSCLHQLNDYDHDTSYLIHKLSLGMIDYLFLLGAFMFGSKFMPVTLVCTILLVGFGGFVFCAFASLVTVILTEFGKRFFGRPRPDPQILGEKQFDLRTPLKNCSFPSGDTAQSAVYGTSLYVLMGNPWFFFFIPMAMWSRIYFGCHYIGDCLFGAVIGIAVGFALWAILPHSFLFASETTVHQIVNGL